MKYNLGGIRVLLEEAYNGDEFSNICFDHFPEVYNQFIDGQTKSARVRMLLTHAQQQGQLDALLEMVRQDRATLYVQFESRIVLVVDGSTEQKRPINLYEVPAPSLFIGRVDMLAYYHQELQQRRFVIIQGMAGAGKTTVGAQLARQVQTDPTAIFWFSFDIGNTSIDAVFRALGEYLEAQGQPYLLSSLNSDLEISRPPDFDATLKVIAASLVQRPYTLCFDNLEYVKDNLEIERFFTALREMCANTQPAFAAQCILMGRDVPAELQQYVSDYLRGFTESEAQAFFAALKTPAPPALLTKIWQRTEGNPQLLELSASELEQLQDNQAEMQRFVDGMSAWDNVGDYVMNHILRALPEEEQTVLRVLSIFPAPVEHEAPQTILESEGITHIMRHIKALGAKCIVNDAGADRIHCHSLVREYCYHDLDQSARQRYHRGAAEYYVGKADYLQAAHHHFARGAPDDALALLTQHAHAIIMAGNALALLDQLTEAPPRVSSIKLWSAVHRTKGDAYRMRADYEQALKAYEAALDVAEDDKDRAELLGKIGAVHYELWDYAAALSYYLQSLELSQTLNNQAGMAEAYYNIGFACYRSNQLAQARQNFERSLEMSQTLQDQFLIAKNAQGLGLIDCREGHLPEAREHLERSENIFDALGESIWQAGATGDLAWVYGEMGDRGQELSLYQQVSETVKTIGDLDGLRIAYNNLGYLNAQLGDHAEAAHYYRELADLAQQTGHEGMRSIAYVGLADALLALGDAQQALAHAEAACRAAEQLGPGYELGLSYRALGDVRLALTEPQAAHDAYEQSVALLEESREGSDDDLALARRGLEAAMQQLNTNTISASTTTMKPTQEVTP